jgi:serine phosphatase RsbU (regulator of sigma subunit)
MAPGDLLVLITDGFFEWSNAAGEQFGVTRLGEAIRRASGLPAEQIIEQLHAAVADFVQGTVQDDDLTAVVIKRTK